MSMGTHTWLAPLIIMVLMGLWWDLHSTWYFFCSDFVEKNFIETGDRVAAWIDDYRSKQDHLPDSLAVEGLTQGYCANRYIDTSKLNHVEFKYSHSGDSTYILTNIYDYMTFESTPSFAGYVFYRDWEAILDTVFRQR